MAAEAAQQALAGAEISAEELDLVIAATSTPDYAFPGVACQVQAAIGANMGVRFDSRGSLQRIPLCCEYCNCLY